MIACRTCGKGIFKILLNGNYLSFEDRFGTAIHTCSKPTKKKSNEKEDHVLLAITITRLSQLEKKFAALENKLNGVKIEI